MVWDFSSIWNHALGLINFQSGTLRPELRRFGTQYFKYLKVAVDYYDFKLPSRICLQLQYYVNLIHGPNILKHRPLFHQVRQSSSSIKKSKETVT